MDYTEFAKNVVEYLQAAGPVVGTGVATGFGTGVGKAVGEKGFEKSRSLLTWLRNKFTRPADRGALDQFEQDPSDPGNCRDLMDQLRKALERDPAFQNELMALLPDDFPAPRTTQISTTIGDGNIAIQNTGDSSNISIQGR